MKIYLSILATAVLLIIFSCQPEQQSQTDYQKKVKQKIAKFDKLYFEAWENEDLDFVMTCLDEEFINMFNFDMSLHKEQCREGFQDVFDTYSIEDVEFKSVEVIVDQNYTIETGLFKQKWITNDKQDTISFDMRCMTVFKKQEDGSWKIFRVMGQQ